MDAGYVAALSGLIGAAIGSASSIATMIIQARAKDRRDRSKQITEMSLAEFKMRLDFAASKQGKIKLLPLSVFIHHNDLILKAIEDGSFTPEKLREIDAAMDKMAETVDQISNEPRREGQS